MSYTTVDNVALFLNRDILDLTVQETTQINLLIQQVDGVINSYCGWDMRATTYTDKRFDGTGTNTMDLELYPINSITQVRVRDTDGSFIDVTAGVETLEGGLIQFLPWATTDVTTFTAGVSNWFLTFNAGFTPEIPAVVGPPAVAAIPTTVPHELSYAASYLVALNFIKIIDESISATEEKFSEITLHNVDMELPKMIKRVLDRHRKVSIY